MSPPAPLRGGLIGCGFVSRFHLEGCAHVPCQKPAAPDRAAFEAMIDVCNRAGVQLMIHENWRFRPWYRALRSELDAGTIGRPIRLRLAHRDTRALRPGGFADQP